MNSGKDQMAGQSGMGRQIGSLFIPNLANHNNIRSLPQNIAQASGKAIADLNLDLRLIDTVNKVFNRVFKGDNVFLFFVQRPQ